MFFRSASLSIHEHNLSSIGSDLPFRITLSTSCMELLESPLTIVPREIPYKSVFPIFTIFLEGICLFLSRALSFFRDNATRSTRRKRQRDKARARARAHLPRKNRVKARCP